jgi:hydroxyacylglutathione hydrolase
MTAIIPIPAFADNYIWLLRFTGGCGRVFEGNPAQMIDSLSWLSAPPAGTPVFCSREHTLANLRFAQAVEWANALLRQRHSEPQTKRDRGEPTEPST